MTQLLVHREAWFREAVTASGEVESLQAQLDRDPKNEEILERLFTLSSRSNTASYLPPILVKAYSAFGGLTEAAKDPDITEESWNQQVQKSTSALSKFQEFRERYFSELHTLGFLDAFLTGDYLPDLQTLKNWVPSIEYELDDVMYWYAQKYLDFLRRSGVVKS